MGLLSKLFGKNAPDPKQESSSATGTVRAKGNPSAKTSIQAGEKTVLPQKGKDPASIIGAFVPGAAVEIQSDRIEPEIPDYQGDYAKAVFLNAYSKASPIKGQGAYQGYLLYECGIRDCPAYHRELVSDGYLIESPIEAIVNAQKVADLKPLLSELGQPVSGKKDVLVERILKNTDEEYLRSKFPVRTYSISEKGQQFLDEHTGYIKLHQHRNWGISWQEFDENKRPGYSDNDIIWGIFNRRVATSSTFGRNEYLGMYQLLVEERKRKDAIAMLLRIIYIDVSGIDGLQIIGLYRDGFIPLKEAQDLFGAAVMVAPGLVGDLPDYSDVYEDSIIDQLYEWKLPINLCDKSTFVKMVHSCMNGSFDEEKFMGQLKRAYNRALKEVRG